MLGAAPLCVASRRARLSVPLALVRARFARTISAKRVASLSSVGSRIHPPPAAWGRPRRGPLTEAARVALERITWSMAHAGDLIIASAKQKNLGDVEHELEKKEHGDEE